jgi:type II secretory pathway component GspD/PulD (secretin)
VSLVENQRSQLQFAERVPVVMGRTIASAGRGTQEAIALENLGTKLSLVGRVDGDSVLVQMELDQTRLIPAPPKPEGEASENVTRPRTATTTFQSTLTIPPGKTVVAGGKETQGDKGKVQTWLLVSARAEGARKDVADGGPQIKIFRLIDAKAESLATVCQGIFAGENLQIGVDARTNSIIARGDEKTLQILARILAGLDEKDLEKKVEAKK